MTAASASEMSVKFSQTMKMEVFWVVAPCGQVWVYQRFRGLYCLHHQGDESQTAWHNNPQADIFIPAAVRT
jgi:hypothetical protein